MIIAVPGSTEAGMARLICVGETAKSGAGTPLIVTVVPASSSGSADPCAASDRTAKFTPKIVAMESAEIGPNRKSAELTAVKRLASTTRIVTCLVSLRLPSPAVNDTVKVLPVSLALGVQRNAPRTLLLVSVVVVKFAPGGRLPALSESGAPEPRSLAVTLNLTSTPATAICVAGTASVGGTGLIGIGEIGVSVLVRSVTVESCRTFPPIG